MAKKYQSSLIRALLIIVVSMFCSAGLGHFFLRYKEKEHLKETQVLPVISSLIQTGPQREALPSSYLEELMDLSFDRPFLVKELHLQLLQKRLLKSPLISRAAIKLIKPSTLYVDYTVRQPIVWLEDYENIALDQEGYPLPFAPFFSPKNLPSLYLGLASAGSEKFEWNTPLNSPLVELGFAILSYIQNLKEDSFWIERVDLSNAKAASFGKREVVVIIHNVGKLFVKGQSVDCHQRCFLRLNPKRFSQELANYFALRKQLIEQESSTLASSEAPFYLKDQILDFRVGSLAFIKN